MPGTAATSAEADAQLQHEPAGNDIMRKLPPIPKGATIRRRPVPARTASTRSARRIYVTAKTPFRSVTTRVRKQLDRYLREASSSSKTFTNKLATNKHVSLDERVSAIQRRTSSNANRRGGGGGGAGSGIGLEDAGEVLVCGTGRAIQKTLEVASYFQKQPDCTVQVRTGSVGAVDDVVAAKGEDDNDDDEDPWGAPENQRVRMMSSLEVSIRLR
ncbi:Rpp20 subunit of nuclear RNase MRP and P-domain-containing protein [Xylariaceae sp. FL0804]|nr:Rpp20 subunit of nuclear RNase MRP and P-domain-containing protein [Xylariaceae sp. FL0804]